MNDPAHSIPWSSLASNFEYSRSADSSGTFDIRTRDQAGQRERLVHFIKTCATALRSQAATERRRYAPAKKFEELAQTWTKSDRELNNAGHVSDSEERDRRAEARKIFSDQEGKSWRIRRREYCSDTDNTHVQYIDNWINGDRHWGGREKTLDNLSTRDEWVTRWTDTWKDLVMEATLVTMPLHQRQYKRNMAIPDHLRHLDTLFLLAHRPDIPLLKWAYEADSCCNAQSGLICVALAALTGYFYFNLLLTMRDQGSDICGPAGEPVPPIDHYRKRLDEDKRLKSPPRYMVTPSWSKLLAEVCSDHEHHAEVMMFEPFLFPSMGENFTVLSTATHPVPQQSISQSRFYRYGLMEANVIPPASDIESKASPDSLAIRGSGEALQEFLSGLWNLLVVFEMLWVEQGSSINWEVLMAQQLETCFTGQDGEDWSLFWDNRDQMLEYHVRDLFIEGKIERPSSSE